jgi:formate dehydrogenase subunit gamma
MTTKEEAAKVPRVVVKRHAIGYRLLHWGFVLGMLFLVLTGLQIGGIYGNLPLVSNVRALHTVVGMAWVCVCFCFLYYLIATKDYRWYGLRRIPMAIGFLLKEAKAWLGIGPHVEEPILYDVKRGEYVEKLIPTVVVVWWIYLLLAAFMAITGTAMVFPEYMGFVYNIASSLSPIFGGVGSYSIVRASHRFGMFLFITVAIMHVYAAFVFRMLRSIVFGDREEPSKK